MSRPKTRPELLDRNVVGFDRLMAAVEAVDAEHRLGPSAYPRGSVKDMLAHLAAWHELFLEWERVGRGGIVPAIPAPGFTWRDLPAFNLGIHEQHEDDAWDDVLAHLDDSHVGVVAVIESYGDDELFVKKLYPWTGSTSVGSYAVSATTSHYDWAMKLLRKSAKGWADEKADG